MITITDPGRFVLALRLAMVGASDDVCRPTLNGVHFVPSEGRLLMEATDAYMAVRATIEADTNDTEGFVVSLDGLNVLTGLLLDDRTPRRITLTPAAHEVRFDVGFALEAPPTGLTLVTVEGAHAQYPDLDTYFAAASAHAGAVDEIGLGRLVLPRLGDLVSISGLGLRLMFGGSPEKSARFDFEVPMAGMAFEGIAMPIRLEASR